MVVEDTGEAPYRIHRGLSQLRLAGKLAQLQGFVFGRFTQKKAMGEQSVEEEVFKNSLQDIFQGLQYPIYFSREFGHQDLNYPLPLGCTACLESGGLTIKEMPVESSVS